MDERQYLQQQITELTGTLEAHRVLTQNALDAAGENKATLKALHKRIDELAENQVSKSEITDILQNSVNGAIAKGFKTVTLSILGGIGVWIVSHFEAIWK